MIWWENSLGFFTHVIAPIYPKNLTQIIARHEERKIIVKYLRKSRKRKKNTQDSMEIEILEYEIES